MVDNWFRLGFIVDTGDGLPVETERTAVCRDCFIITDRNEIGEEEAQALINSGQQIQDAFHVVVEGFSPNDLQITTATPSSMQLQAWAPKITFNPSPTQMFQQVNDMLLENNGALNQPQRITFGYTLSFKGTNDFTLDVVPIQLTASIHGVSSNATIDLTRVDAPYMDHGPISWLSNDTRVFKVQQNQTVVGAPAMSTDPYKFLHGVLKRLRTDLPADQAYQAFESLPAGEDASDQLEWNQTINNQPVWNFALCRIRYRATVTDAVDVRVFFRLFQTAATGTEYNSATTYRVGGQPGVKIPVLGIQGGELVTIPFFAEPRKAATINLNHQADHLNKQTIHPALGGHEACMYYGVYLDINQPNDNRFPIQPSPPDGGPFTGTLLSIQDLIRGTHQCMVTEINFDQEAISPPGISTASSQMLSQRNLAIDNSDNPGSPATHRVQHTFTIHPTTSQPQPKQAPDELMIVWGNTPLGTEATLYMPGVRTSEVLDLAARNFNLQTLERVDDHTLRCKTAGVTYIPIPAGGSLDLAGLLTLDLPANARRGQTFRVVMRQVVDQPAPLPSRPSSVVVREVVPQSRHAAVIERQPTPSRHVLGAFQLSIQVRTAHEILADDERNLRLIERVVKTIPLENRWYPVFRRWISQLAGRVSGLGGHGPGHGGHGGPGGEPGEGGEHGPGEELIGYEGKVSGLVFDRFGDFEGFWLDTEDGKRRFHTREKASEELVRTAWVKRIAVLVIVEKGDRERPQKIVLLRPPAEI
jgi:hypothetical protein